MNHVLRLMSEDETRRGMPDGDEAGLGALRSKRGLLPLKAMDVRGRIDGLLAQVSVRQTFVNVLDEPLEATYIFPLPDRAAVIRFRMEVAGRVVEGVLEERAQARQEYQQAIEAGHRASIAEEERPGVFTLRVGNLPPGEEAVIELALTGPLPFTDGEVTFRFPLVVAPRYIPGIPLPGPSTGSGVAHDTDAVPDASRITPPVLLPGFPNPIQLALTIDVHESVATVGSLRSSLHAVLETGAEAAYRRVTLRNPGERLDRDFILRFRLGTESIATSLSVHPDANAEGQDAEGTFALTIVPPDGLSQTSRPRDLIFVLDRSGSMAGWKMVAARRALARMVDTLGAADRFNVFAFDNQIERPPGFSERELVAATDRQRFRAVEFLATLDARGGTEMAEPLDQGVEVLTRAESGRDRILVLVTDGQVGNEDQILQRLGRRLQGIRIFTLGIDRAVNAGFLQRLAELGGGTSEIVESEDRLDEVMDAVHRRIGTPVLTTLRLEQSDARPVVAESLVPARIPDLFASAPVLILGRYRGRPFDALTVSGHDAAGEPWSETVAASVRENPAIAAAWARGQVRKLEDRYVTEPAGAEALEQEIVATSLKFGVLCRFTAYVAIDRSEVVNPGGKVHPITQPVESPAGWERAGGLNRARMLFAAPASLSPVPPPAAMSDSMDSCLMEFARYSYDDTDADLETCELSCGAPPPTPEPRTGSIHDALSPRDRARRLLEELEALIQSGISTPLDALQAILTKLKAVAKDWSRLDRSASGLPELQQLIEDLRKFLKSADPKKGTIEALALSPLSPLAARIKGLLTSEELGPKSAEPKRESFWKFWK